MKRFAIFCAGLLVMLGGCWSSKEPEEAPTTKPAASQSSAPPRLPSSSGERGMSRELVDGNYRLKLYLAKQVLRLDMEKPLTVRPAAGAVMADDSVTVVPPTADVRVEKTVLARVSAGQVLSVTEVKGDFVGVSMLVAGKPVAGWLRRQDVAFKASEPKLEATLAGMPRSDMVPAAMLVQKAKIFDDGLYAAVELAAQDGAGRFAGKQSMLTALIAGALKKATAPSQTPIVLLAGAKLGGVADKFPPAIERAVSEGIASFRRNAVRSLPISFYTWSPELTKIFQEDRMLQTRLGSAEANMLAGALRADASSRATYEAYNELTSRLTNPPVEHDVLQPGGICFFPPSRSFDGDLLWRMFRGRPVPSNFSLMDEMISQVKSGKLSLAPTASSGWYDYAAWSFEPMIVPDKSAEAPRLEISASYREHLKSLFKGALALARETHVKQLAAAPAPSAPASEPEAQHPTFTVRPDLAAEPLATSYLRRALGYRFVASALESTFGREALGQMHRRTFAGPVKTSLAEELTAMEDLFLGAAVVVSRQLGMPRILPHDLEGRAQSSAQTFLDWSADPRKDADLSGDLRMMVPVFVDPVTGRTKVWVFVGWTIQRCEVSFQQRPEVEVVDDSGKPLDASSYEVDWVSAQHPLVTPVVAELYVTQILNRDDFRKHCDTYWTPAAILANLR